jgi:hypothetical protein
LEAAQVRLPQKYAGIRSRFLIMALCYAQPLVRSWQRYRTRFFSYRPPAADLPFRENTCRVLPLAGCLTVDYWSEEGCERTELLGLVIAYLNEHRWGKTIDSGWENWDLEIYCHPWTVVQVCTAQEDHGGGRRLIRVRYRLRPSSYTKLVGFAALAAGGIACFLQAWPAALIFGGILATGLAVWWRGRYCASQAVGLFDAMARQINLIPCAPRIKPVASRNNPSTQATTVEEKDIVMARNVWEKSEQPS